MVSPRFSQRELVVHHRIHALLRQAERGLTTKIVEDAIHTGRRWLERTPGERGGDVWRFEKTVAGRKVFVIGEVLSSQCYVISNWYA